MKAKVIIENGQTEIVLTTENQFEKDVIETAIKGGSEKYTISSRIDADYSYGTYKDHRIVCILKNVRP